MKTESVDLMKLGATMTFLSILLTYVVYSVLLGKSIGNESLSKIDKIQLSSQVSTLSELNHVETRMPAATAFSFIEYNYKDIHEITCFICDDKKGLVSTMDQNLCITSHLKGYVTVLVEYNDAFGLYDITIRAA
jgi:hypothetical protein